MDFLSTLEHGGPGEAMPPGVTPITELKQQKRVSRTLSKAVSLHLEGKLDSAAHLLSKAIADGEREPGLYSALGHIQYEMRDFDGAAATYGQLIDQDPMHRTAHFNLGVCYGHLRQWKQAVDCFGRAIEVDGARNPDAAWFYPEPKDAARQIAGYLAFWKGVTVTA